MDFGRTYTKMPKTTQKSSAGRAPGVLPALFAAPTTSPHQWLAHLQKICAGQRFDQVWFTANVQEKDLSRIRAGENAAIVLNAYPEASVDGKVFDIYLLALLTGVGYLLLKLDCEPAPLILGFVLGPMMEENLRRAMRISSGDPMIFVNRPISLGLLIAATILLLIVALPAIRGKRDEVFQEG